MLKSQEYRNCKKPLSQEQIMGDTEPFSKTRNTLHKPNMLKVA